MQDDQIPGRRTIDTAEAGSAETMSAPTKAEIHLGRLVHNLNVFRRKVPAAEVMAVVKADAYGHGARRVAAALADAGVEWFAVATVAEGIRLRTSGIHGRILVLAAPLREYVALYPEYDLDITVSSTEVADFLLESGRGPYRAHVKIETGMNRIGIPCEDAVRVVRRLEASSHVTIEGLWTHLATADDSDPEFSRRQILRFNEAITPLQDAAARIHIANSAAALRLSQSVQSPGALMRIGIGLYGYSALRGLAEDAGLTPIMRLTSRVTHVKAVAPGTSISYGRRWTAQRPTQIATVGAGYADGLPRLLSNRGKVTVGGRRYPIVGTVCMDMFMIDVGDVSHVAVGDEVVLFGPEGPDAFEVAEWAETIPYEILTGVAARVPRLFVS